MAPPHQKTERWRARYLAPTLALGAAGALLAISFFLPYWEMRLTTPAQPGGLRVVAYLDHAEGPVDALLMSAGASASAQRPQLSELERSLTLATIIAICSLVVAAAFVHNRWAALLALPAFLFPAVAIADTTRWLRPVLDGIVRGGDAGSAAPLLLFGRVAAGDTVVATQLSVGFFLSLAASLAVAAGLWLHRRAYKPLLDAARRAP